MVARPGESLSAVDAARQVLVPVIEKAFRRPVTEPEVARFAELVNDVMSGDESYETGLRVAIQAILVSPDFIFRLEDQPGGQQKQLAFNDFQVASRLSYFLWSSMPDEELWQLAKSDQLHKPDVLKQQVTRMLKDEKASALVDNFAAQWLNLRNLAVVEPNTDIFKSFNEKLRDDMRMETEMLFRTVMQENRDIAELLAADYTFVNKRLAKHYGISGVKNDDFQRVSLAGTKRSGVLTHASILTLTSDPGRTSPVKRGNWIMENIFGDAPPPPPPDVPELDETAEAAPNASLREQLSLIHI